MTRPPRRDYTGAIHHIYIRGVDRSVVAVDSDDYERALLLLEQTASQFEIRCHAWCFLPNHAHMLVTSELGNLSRAMHWFGTCFAQAFNRRHERSGHLFQGRFGSKLVEDDDYLLELAKYVPLNPVSAGLCASPHEWMWSSYAATTGRTTPPWFLDPAMFLHRLGSREAYAAWVEDGVLSTFLDSDGIPRPPVRPTLATLLTDMSERALATAHFRHGYTKAEIARHLGVSRSQIRRRLGPAT